MSCGFLLTSVEGTTLTQADREVIAHPRVAGIVLFRRNFHSIEQLTELTTHIREIRENFLITVDQEGGRVQRFRRGFTMLPAMRHWGEVYQDLPQVAIQHLHDCTHIMVEELQAVGVNVNLVPVLDVDQGKSWVIGGRSFFSDPNVVTALGHAMITALHDAGMPAVGKHFPGHGGVALDSHQTLPIDNRCFDDLWHNDIQPFKQLVHELDAIMPAHVIYSQVDAEPAGFSRVWLHDILREKIGFTGAIISDDLSMAGAASAGSYPERALKALTAGCDLLTVCNNPEGIQSLLTATLPEPSLASSERIERLTSLCLMS